MFAKVVKILNASRTDTDTITTRPVHVRQPLNGLVYRVYGFCVCCLYVYICMYNLKSYYCNTPLWGCLLFFLLIGRNRFY